MTGVEFVAVGHLNHQTAMLEAGGRCRSWAGFVAVRPQSPDRYAAPNSAALIEGTFVAGRPSIARPL